MFEVSLKHGEGLIPKNVHCAAFVVHEVPHKAAGVGGVWALPHPHYESPTPQYKARLHPSLMRSYTPV